MVLAENLKIKHLSLFQANKKQLCRLRVVSAAQLSNNCDSSRQIKSLVSIAYGPFGNNLAERWKNYFRIYMIKSARLQVLRSPDVTKSTLVSKHRPFSMFITEIGKHVKDFCTRRSAEIAIFKQRKTEEIKRFVVIHLRGRDRNCTLKSLTPKNLIEELKKFGIKRESDVVYLMSDLEKGSGHLLELEKFFRGYYLFQASHIKLFNHSVFAKTAPFLIFVVENQLQEVADGVILTYPNHKLRNQKKLMGSLNPSYC